MSETLELEAGRELDALIAERVMGLGPVEHDYPCGIFPDGCEYEAPDTREDASDFLHSERHPIYRHTHENGWAQPRVVPFYSTDMAAAWEVVEAMESKGWDGTVRCTSDGYRAVFESVTGLAAASVDPREGNAPLAICRAALKALPSPTPEGTP